MVKNKKKKTEKNSKQKYSNLVFIVLIGIVLCLGLVYYVLSKNIELQIVGYDSKSLTNAKVLIGDDVLHTNSNGVVRANFFGKREIQVSSENYNSKKAVINNPLFPLSKSTIELDPVNYSKVVINFPSEFSEVVRTNIDKFKVGDEANWEIVDDQIVSSELELERSISITADIGGYTPIEIKSQLEFGNNYFDIEFEENLRKIVNIKDFQTGQPLSDIGSNYSSQKTAENGNLELQFLQNDNGDLVIEKEGYITFSSDKKEIPDAIELVPAGKKIVYTKVSPNNSEPDFRADLDLIKANIDGSQEQIIDSDVFSVGYFDDHVLYAKTRIDPQSTPVSIYRYDLISDEKTLIEEYQKFEVLNEETFLRATNTSHLYSRSIVKRLDSGSGVSPNYNKVEVKNLDTDKTELVRERSYNQPSTGSFLGGEISHDGTIFAYTVSEGIFNQNNFSFKFSRSIKVVNIQTGEVYLDKKFPEKSYPIGIGISPDNSKFVYLANDVYLSFDLNTKQEQIIDKVNIIINTNIDGKVYATKGNDSNRVLGLYDYNTNEFQIVYDKKPIKQFFTNGNLVYLDLGDGWYYFDGKNAKKINIDPQFHPAYYLWGSFTGFARGI